MSKVLPTLSVLASIPCISVLLIRCLDRRRRLLLRVTYAVSFPRGIEPAAVESFVRSLTGLQPPWWRRVLFGLPSIVFEVHANYHEITFRLHVEVGAHDFVLGQLRRSFPAVRLERLEVPPFVATLAAELRLSSAERMLSVNRPVEASSALLAALRPLAERGEELLMQWIVAPATTALADAQRAPSLVSTLRGSPQPGSETRPDKVVREKRVGPHFHAVARLAVIAGSPERSRQLIRRLLGVFHIVNTPGASFRRRALPSAIVAGRVAKRVVPGIAYPCYLNARELTALLAIPMGGVIQPGLNLGRARQLPVSTKLPVTGPALAVSNYPGSPRFLTYGVNSLPFHAWIVGGTGSGKSTLLLNILSAYMRLGATIVVLDSKRDLVRDAVDLIPPERAADLVLVDPADERPVGLNLLAGGPANADRTADQLVGLLSRIWPGYVGPRSQDILRASFLTLANTPCTTFVELPLLLLDDAYRHRLVANVDDPIVLEPQWAAYDQLTPGDRAQQIAAPLNKVRAVLARRALRDIVGQADGLDVADVLARGSILLVPLSKGLIGEDAAALLGAILLVRVWQALTARMELSTNQRKPVVVVLDEFQDYMAVPLSFADMLAQARALGVGVLAAHQHLGQLPAHLRADLRANARTKIAFQLAAPDARVFADELAPHLLAEDLQGLGRYEIAAQLCVDGEVLPPATGTTFPAPEPTGAGELARRLSAERFGRTHAEVEAEIRARQGDRPGPGSVGRRRRP